MQQALRNRFERCTVDVPMVALSGVDSESMLHEHDGFSAQQFDFLWDHISTTPMLDCQRLGSFEGLDAKVTRITAERDFAQRQAAARKYFFEVATSTLVFWVVCFGFLRPIVNFSSTCLDEVAYVTLFIFMIGWQKFFDFLVVLWDDHILAGLQAREIVKEDFVIQWRYMKEATGH